MGSNPLPDESMIAVSIRYMQTDTPPPIHDDPVQLMLTRHPPLKAHHQSLLSVLYRASDWIGAKTICREMGIGQRALLGVMGSFGRRCAGTPGWPKQTDKRPS